MSADNTFQLSTKAAEGYETQKVPSLFGPLARATIEAISLPESAHVIDIACGTGIIAKVVAERLTGEGRIVGTDLNSAMIEVANRTMPFGKFKGRTLIDLPEGYLLWFVDRGFPTGQLGYLMQLTLEIKINGLDALIDPLRSKPHDDYPS